MVFLHYKSATLHKQKKTRDRKRESAVILINNINICHDKQRSSLSHSQMKTTFSMIQCEWRIGEQGLKKKGTYFLLFRISCSCFPQFIKEIEHTLENCYFCKKKKIVQCSSKQLLGGGCLNKKIIIYKRNKRRTQCQK